MTPTQREAALRLVDIALKHSADSDSDISEETALLRELAAEPVQEPTRPYINCWAVREVWFDDDGNPGMHRDSPQAPMCYLRQTSSDRNPPHGWAVHFSPIDSDIPLYAAPQQRKPLTDEQIASLSAWDDYLGGCITLLDFARAVERAHGIKEAT